MNHLTLGLGVGLGIGVLAVGGGIAYALTHRDEKSTAHAPTDTDAFAASTVRDFDRHSRNGNFDGVVDIAAEGTRLVLESTHIGRPRPGGNLVTEYDSRYDGTALWTDVDAAGNRDGTATSDELSAFLRTNFAGGDGTIDSADHQRLVTAYRDAFTPDTYLASIN